MQDKDNGPEQSSAPDPAESDDDELLRFPNEHTFPPGLEPIDRFAWEVRPGMRLRHQSDHDDLLMGDTIFYTYRWDDVVIVGAAASRTVMRYYAMAYDAIVWCFSASPDIEPYPVLGGRRPEPYDPPRPLPEEWMPSSGLASPDVVVVIEGSQDPQVECVLGDLLDYSPAFMWGLNAKPRIWSITITGAPRNPLYRTANEEKPLR